MSWVGTGTDAGTWVIAHRGLALTAAENSVRSFVHALDAGADAIELDVRRTRDGVLVLHHDAKLADGRRISRMLAADLPQVDGAAFPTLGDAARLASERGAYLVVEPKRKADALAAVDELLRHLPPEQFEMESFSAGAVRRIRWDRPDVQVGLLTPRLPAFIRDTAVYRGAVHIMDFLDWQPGLNRAVRAGADFASVDSRRLTPKFMRGAQRRGMPVDTWTVNTEAEMRRTLDLGVRSLLTDRPDLAVPIRNALTHATEHS